MSSRKLVSVQQIIGIDPIEGADRIEVARVLGWKIVVNKDMHLKPGDKVAYFETDSLLPEINPVYAPFQSRGQKTMLIEGGKEVRGHVLRTMKLRGVYSQGLIMSLNELGIASDTPVGTDITMQTGVVKYEEPIPVGGNQIGRFNAPCDKSDAPRVQSIAAVQDEIWNTVSGKPANAGWEELKSLKAVPTVKVDGTSTTLYKDGDNNLHVYSRNWELAADSTNMQVALRAGLDTMLEPGMVCQFEMCGPGIQSNRLKLAKLQPFVFAVWKNHHKIDREDWNPGLLAWAAPQLDETEWALTGSMDDMIRKVDGLRGNVTPNLLDEGIVWHVRTDQQISPKLAAMLGDNRCFKIINNKYLTKYGL
ncbi:RNA ligase family protein [Bifidobacterium callitrichidarum]|uniref:2'-5' RNA ligase n=1 Tax=Bifidobacterium callitrichidarum TaxID=2052941 RepID=A0A2U2N8Z6_9BIFI|nr:RNA ligase family protein [Bifidobacterium callitrichidarum]PWG65641.1 2'-5' RNA ligase [Bifidobacterium callitrichidarum]